MVYVSFIDDVKDTFNTSNEISIVSQTNLYELTANETNISDVEANDVSYVDSDYLNSASFLPEPEPEPEPEAEEPKSRGGFLNGLKAIIEKFRR